VLLDTKDVDGHRIQFRYDAPALWDKQQWTAGGEGPQLSLEAATKIAMGCGVASVPEGHSGIVGRHQVTEKGM